MNDVCYQCARRAWLLSKLGVRLDYSARDPSRFWSILELPDPELIDALGGRRRAALRAAHAEWEPTPSVDRQPRALCRHHVAYPQSLREDALAPHSLEVRGPGERLAGMLDGKIVAIVGTRRASDYGMETARELARGLAASGITVASGLAEGIPRAVHAGALEADGATLAVMTGGVERCTPAWCAPLYGRILERGCAIAEPHMSLRVRHWCQYASARTLALLVHLVIVVEATEQPSELACAKVAWSRARHVAAVPGRVSSPASRGSNSLLMNGARLVRGPQDALDVLYGVGVHDAAGVSAGPAALQPRLARVLERVSDGEDTVAKLTARGTPSDEISVALAELELCGLLLRGDAGRYVPLAGGSQAEHLRRIAAAR
ncbi:MAG TPA: DNA-processing protein DprA [Solirubrobacteraceae bacterium]